MKSTPPKYKNKHAFDQIDEENKYNNRIFITDLNYFILFFFSVVSSAYCL